MTSPNRRLLITFIVLAIGQTALPIIAQKMSRAIVYHDFLHVAIAACAATVVAVAFYQALRRRFGAGAMLAFYSGLALLVAYDIWIESIIDATV